MLSFTKRIDYGLIAMTTLCGSSQPVSARGLAERHGLSYPLLANVLKSLGHAGLVDSTRGKNGGYRLIVDPAFTTVRDVIEAVEGPFQLADCTGHDQGAGCCHSEACNVKWSVHKIHEAIADVLSAMTLSDILSQSQAGARRVLVESGSEHMGFQQVPLNLEV